MTPELVEAIVAHAARELPREACGLIVRRVGEAVYFPCRNEVAEEHHFDIAAEDWVVAEDAGEVLAIVHTHTDGTYAPSEKDREQCDKSGFPWYVFGLHGKWTRFTPKNWSVTGKPFTWGVQDCYTLAHDWMGNTPDYERSEGFWRRSDLFGRGVANSAFTTLPIDEEPRLGDLLLFSVRGKYPDHCAIYLGDGNILHHSVGRLSAATPIGNLVEKLYCIVRR